MGSLEITQDLRLQRRVWAFQRAAWVGLLLILGAASLGFLGPGPFSSHRASDPSGMLRLEYERVTHNGAPTTLRFELGPGASSGGAVRLWIDRAYLERVEVHEITPAPLRSAAGEDRVVFEFASERPGAPGWVRLDLEPDRSGLARLRAGVPGGAELAVTQVVLP